MIVITVIVRLSTEATYCIDVGRPCGQLQNLELLDQGWENYGP
jgi:hypothetical protein